MTRAYRAAVAVLAVTMTVSACIKSTTFNPYAPPDTGELDRLQQTVNAAADLEPTRAVLNQLDTQIRATIAKYSPQTMLAPYGIKEAFGNCQQPYTWAVGQQYTPAPLSGKPAPTAAQWQQITAALKPVFDNAGFQPGKEPIIDGIAYGDGSAFVSLTNGGEQGTLMSKASTGCRMPTAWRSTPPPPGTFTPDPVFHYPYLFGGEGGRSREPGT